MFARTGWLLVASAWAVGSALVACGDDDGVGGAADGGAGGEGGVVNRDFVAGGDRPVTVRVPPDYDPATPAPLVILLHGYGANGGLQDVYFELSDAALARGVIFAAPDGTMDLLGRPFWNATDACCNFDDIEVDDSSYLIGLVDEISAELAVDPKRVFFAGHSNGGFMSHRMACEYAPRIAAIATLAGAMHLDPADCGATEPVNVLEIHGTEDETIHYDGGTNIGDPYPGVAVTLATWIDINGCDGSPESGAPLDLEYELEGAETTVDVYGGCASGGALEHWAMQGGKHIPVLYDSFGDVLLDFLLAHPKP